ncbi:hypothetical protein D3C77_452160 [compost metagenome]
MLFQGVFVFEHPLPQPRTLGACLHFLGKDMGITPAPGKVSNHGAQQQHHNFLVPARNVVGRPLRGKGIVLAERIQAVVTTGAIPGDIDSVQVILANTWQPLDKKLGNRHQPEHPQ